MLKALQNKEANRPSGVKEADDWELYILRCGDNSFYTGVTNNLERRLKMHQTGKASRYTRVRRPVEMIYHEKCGTRTQALVRECAVKELPRKKKEELISGATRNAQRSTKKRKRKRCALRVVR
ncbi:MAG: GIY-YIG nuclease family protein [Candidatus Omnitrophica bacterium]|nr:GIY-YIG nuclease family protein [Candidatus Omnitrophota bacterium]